MDTSKNILNRKKDLHKKVEEALNKRRLLADKNTPLIYRSVFYKKVKKQDDTEKFTK